MRMNISKEWCEKAAEMEEGCFVTAINPNLLNYPPGFQERMAELRAIENPSEAEAAELKQMNIDLQLGAMQAGLAMMRRHAEQREADKQE